MRSMLFAPTTSPRLMKVAAVLLCIGGLPAARAQDASAWDTESHAAVRLLAGSLVKTADTAFLRAGLEIKLDPGWKTYWRDPGDSGVPPTLDFKGSVNVNGVTILWPAPERFPDGAGGHSIGYTDHLILPLRIVPADAAKGALVNLKFAYAVCGNLCEPAEANLHLSLSGKSAEDPVLEQAEARVPRHVALGEGRDKGLAVLSAHREPGDAHERVEVEVAAPAGARVDLFVEGPTSEWSLPLPEPQGADGTVHSFVFDLDGLPPGAKAEGAMLTFTAVSGADAIEVPVRLD